MSVRMQNTDPPFIEDVLERYASYSDLTRLALGSSHWGPPTEACNALLSEINSSEVHRYGSIMGLHELRSMLLGKLVRLGLDMSEMELMVTTGANQAFVNAALSICDHGDNAVLISPFYFSHKCALQIAGAKIHESNFDPKTIKPSWDILEEQCLQLRPTVVVLTTPNNPSGATWNELEIEKIIDICRKHNSWLVVDQTYHEFYFDGVEHVFPCGRRFSYSRIIHIFSLSKSFGMPGWRVGYLVYPTSLSTHIRKVQDTLPTHCSVISQRLAVHAIQHDEQCRVAGSSWVAEQVHSLEAVREAIWEAVKPLGTVRTHGAFYFLVPLPPLISEEEAVCTLADRFRILLMHGGPFGACGHLRLSYGSLPPNDVMCAVTRLADGIAYLLDQSKLRVAAAVTTTVDTTVTFNNIA